MFARLTVVCVLVAVVQGDGQATEQNVTTTKEPAIHVAFSGRGVHGGLGLPERGGWRPVVSDRQPKKESIQEEKKPRVNSWAPVQSNHRQKEMTIEEESHRKKEMEDKWKYVLGAQNSKPAEPKDEVKQKRELSPTLETNHEHAAPPKQKYKTVTITQKVPVPYPVTVEKKVPVHVQVPVDKPYPVYVPKPYPVTVEKEVPYPVKVPVPHPYTVEKKIPFPYKVPVDQPVPVPVDKPYPFYVEKKVPYPVEKTIHYPVKVPFDKPIPVPVPVDKFIHFPVEKAVPYPVKVPVDRPVPVHIDQPIPFPVERHVPVPLVKNVPYPIKVPVKIPVHIPYPVPVKAANIKPAYEHHQPAASNQGYSHGYTFDDMHTFGTTSGLTHTGFSLDNYFNFKNSQASSNGNAAQANPTQASATAAAASAPVGHPVQYVSTPGQPSTGNKFLTYATYPKFPAIKVQPQYYQNARQVVAYPVPQFVRHHGSPLPFTSFTQHPQQTNSGALGVAVGGASVSAGPENAAHQQVQRVVTSQYPASTVPQDSPSNLGSQEAFPKAQQAATSHNGNQNIRYHYLHQPSYHTQAPATQYQQQSVYPSTSSQIPSFSHSSHSTEASPVQYSTPIFGTQDHQEHFTSAAHNTNENSLNLDSYEAGFQHSGELTSSENAGFEYEVSKEIEHVAEGNQSSIAPENPDLGSEGHGFASSHIQVKGNHEVYSSHIIHPHA